MKPLKAFNSFLRLNVKEKKDTLLIILIYIKVSCMVKCSPLRKYFFRFFHNSSEKPVDLAPYKQGIQFIQKVIKQLPGKQTCLKESIIVHLFFKRKGICIPLYLGVNIKNEFLAHAWYDKNNSIGYRKL